MNKVTIDIDIDINIDISCVCGKKEISKMTNISSTHVCVLWQFVDEMSVSTMHFCFQEGCIHNMIQ